MPNRTKLLFGAFSVILLLGVMGYAGPLASSAPVINHDVQICFDMQNKVLEIVPEFQLVKRNDTVTWVTCSTGPAATEWEVDLGPGSPAPHRHYDQTNPTAKIRLTAKRGDYKYTVGAMHTSGQVFTIDPELIVRP